MEDLKLKYANFEMRKNFLVSHIANDDLKRVAAAYEDNMHQVESIIRGFLSLMSVVTRYEGAMVESCHTLTGKYRQVQGDEKDVELQKKLDEMLHAKVDALEARMKTDLEGARREDQRLLNNINWVLAAYGTNNAENEHIRHVRNMYKSMIVGAWTAFEVMAVDLWESALNQHPKILASIARTNGVKGEGDKKLDLSILEQ